MEANMTEKEIDLMLSTAQKLFVSGLTGDGELYWPDEFDDSKCGRLARGALNHAYIFACAAQDMTDSMPNV
jgi:hypothetical protein